MRPSLSLSVCIILGAVPALLACSADTVTFWADPPGSGGAASGNTSLGGTPSGTTGSGGTDSQSSGGAAGENGTGGASATAGTSSGGSSGGSDASGGSGGTGGSGGSDAVGGSGGSLGGTAGTDAGGSGGASTVDPVLLHADFQKREAGTYTEAMVEGDFGSAPESSNGLEQQRAKIVIDGDERFLRVTFPANKYGPTNGGVQFKVALPESYDELYLSYRVRFAENFQFVKEGKLPGLVGGTAPTGCSSDDDGFSTRGMWLSQGRAAEFVNYAEKESLCEDELDYERDGDPFSFERGIWITVEHHLLMNTAGGEDGALEVWIDGAPVLSLSDFVYRVEGGTFGIDTFFFSTYFGGTDLTYAPKIAQTLDYDDFVISTAPISH